MREILYRAKAINRDRGYHRTNYKNGDFVYGLVTRLYDEKFENLPAEMTDMDGVTGIEVDYKTIGQYTGLTDKNGTKIFEGDIVHCWYEDYSESGLDSEFYAIVQFGNPNGNYTWGYQLRKVKGDKINYDILLWVEMEDAHAYCEVIGNIHDTPELVKGV